MTFNRCRWRPWPHAGGGGGKGRRRKSPLVAAAELRRDSTASGEAVGGGVRGKGTHRRAEAASLSLKLGGVTRSRPRGEDTVMGRTEEEDQAAERNADRVRSPGCPRSSKVQI